MTYAVHSPNNAEILARFMEDLEKAGYNKDKDGWNQDRHPLGKSEAEFKDFAQEKGRSVWYYTIFVVRGTADYNNHDCDSCDKHFDLTEENYNEVLSEILN